MSAEQAESKGVSAPVAKRVPYTLRVCGREWEDPYFWIRDDSREREDVLDLLKQENAYTEHVTKPLEPFRKSLYTEILSHLKEDDSSVPFRYGPYFYSRQTIKGKDYPVYRRGPLPDEAHQTEVILDVNALAEGFSFFDLDDYEPSPDHTLLAYSADTTGYETFDIRIKDLKTGKLLDDLIPKTSGNIEWSADNSYLFYSTDDHAHRPHKLWRHKIGTDAKEDECLFTEDDERFRVSFFKTRSEQYFFVNLSSAVTSEVHMITAAETIAPKPQFRLIKPRVQDVEYSFDHSGDYFWIVSNEEAKNFAVWRAPVDKPGREHWEPVLVHDPAVKIEFVECFKKYVIVFGREKGLTSLRVLYLDTAAHPPSESKQVAAGGSVVQPALYRSELLSFEEPVYTLGHSVNYVFDTDYLRFTYTSLVTPSTVYDYYFETRQLQLKKKTEVPDYDASLYASQRLFATASDGTQIPMSIVYRKDKVNFGDESAKYKTFVMGYGAYGISDDPAFRYTRLPLLDRGVIFVIAHLRGGGEMGRLWYENGKYLSKKNTFTDFIAVLEHLIKIKVTSPEHLVITGGSAGGLLMGAVINMRPDLFKAALTDVPFVDIVASVSDANLPLSVGEWEEWGNPNEEKFFEYIKSYSPYDNVTESGEFPNIFITTGLNDYRVAYWEPIKWLSKMRHVLATKRAAGHSGPEPLLLVDCKMDSGHAGASGRYAYLEDLAREYTFVLDQFGLVQK